jgi:hypothetical protein
MSKRYIPQLPSNDFVYPNNDRVEYDQEIVHEINNNTVTGSVSGLTLSIVDVNDLQLQYTYTWNRNDAEVWIRNSNLLGLLSVHVLAPGQDYFKPWKIWDSVANSNLNLTTSSSTITRTIVPSFVGLTGFPNGEYTFEFRFIGKLQPYVVCATATLSGSPVTPTPTPTPTITPGPDTPTPTPTQTPTPTPTSGGCTVWELIGPTFSGEILEVEYIPCGLTGTTTIQVFWNTTPQYEYICAENGSVSIVDNGINGAATNTGTVCLPQPTPTPTSTPTPSPTPVTIYTHGAVRATCADFCTTNYNITTVTSSTADYASLGIGDTISGITGSGYIAYSSISTDTSTGPFKIAEIDSSGVVLDISECVASSCVPL